MGDHKEVTRAEKFMDKNEIQDVISDLFCLIEELDEEIEDANEIIEDLKKLISDRDNEIADLNKTIYAHEHP